MPAAPLACVDEQMGALAGRDGSPEEKSGPLLRMCMSTERLFRCAAVDRIVAVPSPRMVGVNLHRSQ